MKPIARTLAASLAGATALLLALPAQATLYDRGNGMVYDSASNLTWMQDAGSSGTLSWDAASAWVDQLSWGGFDDWRLPVVRPVNGISLNLDYSDDGSTDGGINTAGLNSELGHLFYTSLGNQAATGLSQAGPFTHTQNFAYWTGTASPYGAEEALHFFTAFGDQGSSLKVNEYFVWAVRDGDVLAVPEPHQAALLLLGLCGLALVRFTAARQEIRA